MSTKSIRTATITASIYAKPSNGVCGQHRIITADPMGPSPADEMRVHAWLSKRGLELDLDSSRVEAGHLVADLVQAEPALTVMTLSLSECDEEGIVGWVEVSADALSADRAPAVTYWQDRVQLNRYAAALGAVVDWQDDGWQGFGRDHCHENTGRFPVRDALFLEVERIVHELEQESAPV